MPGHNIHWGGNEISDDYCVGKRPHFHPNSKIEDDELEMVSLSPLEHGSFNTKCLSAKLNTDANTDANIDAHTDANTDVNKDANTDANTDAGWYHIVKNEHSHCHLPVSG